MPFPSLPAPLARALTERGYSEPTPVQAAVLDAAAGARDLLVSAQTGSGKTVAYGLAMAGTLLRREPSDRADPNAGRPSAAGEERAITDTVPADIASPDPTPTENLPRAGAPLALVIAPTRELALQVQRELAWLYAPAGGRVTACVGGMDPRREARMLADGTHMVVGTPGRLRDHLERRNLDPRRLRAVVLDEADEMLDLGFREDLEFILSATPPERATYLFSATLPKGIEALAEGYQRDALRLAVKGEARGHADIAYRAIRVVPRETEHAVINLLREADAPAAIVFCNTRNAVRHLQASLLERGFSVVGLSGEMGQGERNGALQALRDGRARVCVATDVAARGIDLPSVELVVHADLPHDAEVMQHRSGRTGRAGRKGVSAVLVPNARRRRAEQMFAVARVSPDWSGPPTADEIRRLDGERMLSDPLFADEPAEEDLGLAETLLARKSPEQLAALLARVYRTRLPAPEEVSDPGERRPSGPERRPYDPTAPERVAAMGPAVWFRLNLGRRDDADPRRLLPLLTRRGGVDRQEIGAIRIFDRETKFEVRGAAAARFAEAFARTGSPEIRVEALPNEAAPSGRGGHGPGGGRSFQSPRAGKHRRGMERGAKPGRGAGPG